VRGTIGRHDARHVDRRLGLAASSQVAEKRLVDWTVEEAVKTGATPAE